MSKSMNTDRDTCPNCGQNMRALGRSDASKGRGDVGARGHHGTRMYCATCDETHLRG